MTIIEFSNEFDIEYNSIATNTSPGIDLYEKSVYLTRAQLEIVKNYFNPNGNKYKTGFEGDSKRRNDLSELITPHSSTTEINSSHGLSIDSQFFTIPLDTFLILQESAKITSNDTCVNNTYVDVIPKTHDEYNVQKKNPFRIPDKNKIWRIDFSKQGGNRNVELISPYTVSEYKNRYVKYPSPIILADLDSEFAGEGLSIDGITTSQTSSLVESIHREILNRAVEMALVDYKPQNAQIKTQLDLRNE